MMIELTTDQARSILISIEKELDSYRRVPVAQRTFELAILEKARERVADAIQREEWEMLDGAKAPQDVINGSEGR